MAATNKHLRFKEISEEVIHDNPFVDPTQVRLVLQSTLEIIARDMQLWPFEIMEFLSKFSTNCSNGEK